MNQSIASRSVWEGGQTGRIDQKFYNAQATDIVPVPSRPKARHVTTTKFILRLNFL